MVYICADDYGLCESASLHIQQCVDAGALNKVSVFPNFNAVDLQNLSNKPIRIALHLNLVEGMCMASPAEVDLLADTNGRLKHAFGGLLKLSIFRKKAFEEQVYKEIKAQVLFWKDLLPQGTPFAVDGHQHTHMIPAVFRALLKVLREEEIVIEHMRIPAEPLLPYIQTPSLYASYKVINLIKQWLLKALWALNKPAARKQQIPTSLFFGILFSGCMDAQRIAKVLPKYIRLAEKTGRDVEVLFHPGYVVTADPDFAEKNVVFEKFYVSDNRKTEFDSVIKLAERRTKNAVY